MSPNSPSMTDLNPHDDFSTAYISKLNPIKMKEYVIQNQDPQSNEYFDYKLKSPFESSF